MPACFERRGHADSLEPGAGHDHTGYDDCSGMALPRALRHPAAKLPGAPESVKNPCTGRIAERVNSGEDHVSG